MGRGLGGRVTGLSLQDANLDFVEGLTGFVAVANVFKGFGSVLTSAVEQNLLAARVLVEELGAVVDFVVNHYIYVLFGVVFGNVLVAKL